MENKPASKKPGWRLNLFDIIVIAVAVVACAALLFYWKSSGKGAALTGSLSSATVRYTIELTDLSPDAAQLIKAGDTIVDGKKKYTMGKVVSVTLTDATRLSTDYKNGKIIYAAVPGKKTATVILETSATISDAQILSASGYLIRVGLDVQAVGPGYAALGRLINIERPGDNA